jgi:hypothetical protein
MRNNDDKQDIYFWRVIGLLLIVALMLIGTGLGSIFS